MSEPPRKRMVRPPSGGGDGRSLAQRVKASSAHSASSKAWLERQLNDPFVAAAKAKGYRSRAAFKLIELDERLGLIRPGVRVVDLGAAPGGWLQVLAERGAGQIVGIDLLPIDPLPSAKLVQGDFTEAGCGTQLIDLLGARPDLVLSDMAPNTIGHQQTDHLRIAALIEAAADFAIGALKPGGAFIAKAFQGGETAAIIQRLKTAFETVRIVKPKASRAESAEVYIAALGFRAPAAAP